MDKKKILFFHFDLGNGGAEKVLINLLNNLDPSKYDITLRTVFRGPNANQLNKNIKFKPIFNINAKRGSSRILRLINPKLLYRLFIKDDYDIEIAYLEQIPTRIIGGGTNKKKNNKYAWVHNTVDSRNSLNGGVYRNEKELTYIYSQFKKIAFVSKTALLSFKQFYEIKTPLEVVHNVCEFDKIKNASQTPIDIALPSDCIKFCSVGRLCGQKGYDRLISVLGNLSRDGFKNWYLYLIGEGPEKEPLKALAKKYNIEDRIFFLGFQSNPFKYVAKMDMFICSSLKEGYSTAVTESVVVGTPVLTTDCAGMDELLDEGKVGIIVQNTNEALEEGILKVLQGKIDLNALKLKTLNKAKSFSKENMIKEFEKFVNV